MPHPLAHRGVSGWVGARGDLLEHAAARRGNEGGVPAAKSFRLPTANRAMGRLSLWMPWRPEPRLPRNLVRLRRSCRGDLMH
eukprot:7743014-Alexandrium_andersonii.AAC.1